MRNHQQVLLRRLFHIAQTSTIADYVQRFSDLVDQLAAYDSQPEPVHYLTRFLDGLFPAVRVLVAIQQPEDLDTAFTMALLYEELGEGGNPFSSRPSTAFSARRLPPLPLPPPQPPAKWISKTVKEKKQMEVARPGSDDRWTSLKSYRRARGLCYVCGEKWSKDHQCKNVVPLNMVQELINCMQSEESESGDE